MRYALLVFVLLCGCTPVSMDERMREHQSSEAGGQVIKKFKVGDLVAIKLGGLGMIISDCQGFRGDYLIRTGPGGYYERLTNVSFKPL